QQDHHPATGRSNLGHHRQTVTDVDEPVGGGYIDPMAKYTLSSGLLNYRTQLVDHWVTLLNHSQDTDSHEWLAHAVGRVKPEFSIPFSVTGRVCTEIYAA